MKMKCLEWRLIQDPSILFIFLLFIHIYNIFVDLLWYIFLWTEGLSYIISLPLMIKVRFAYTLCPLDSHLWDYTEYIVIIVIFIFTISFYFVFCSYSLTLFFFFVFGSWFIFFVLQCRPTLLDFFLSFFLKFSDTNI